MSKFVVKNISLVDNYTLWNQTYKKCNGATIFHNVDFLTYHGSRFNESHIAFYKGESIIGLMPLAFNEENGNLIANSPYGGSYGGAIFVKTLNYNDSREIVNALFVYLRSLNIVKIRITPPLADYYTNYSETFLLALLEKGLRIVNSDISSIVSLEGNLIKDTFTSRCRNMMRKAEAEKPELIEQANLQDFWLLMDKTFSRHGKAPTHTLKEFMYLNSKFEDKIYCDVCYIRGEPVAGIGYMEVNSHVNMSFYLCSDPEYSHTQAMTFLVAASIIKSQKNGYKTFDFGTSSLEMKGSAGVFQFKESFGAVGRFRHTYECVLYSGNT